ncbi:hypothetical protein D3C87_1761620 [compost metagenome]
MIRVKPVIMIKIAGASVSTVMIKINLTAFTTSLGLSVVLKPRFTVGRVTCANAVDPTKKTNGTSKRLKKAQLNFLTETTSFL